MSKIRVSRSLFTGALLVVHLASFGLAAQSVTPENRIQKDDASDNIMKEFLDKETLQVPKEKAAICPICTHPYFEHTQAGFECEPTDKLVQKTKWTNVTCPVCQSSFETTPQGHVNSDNGVDRDFCRHSMGKIAVHSSIWMCPECGYAALEKAFGKKLDGSPVDEDTTRIVQDKLRTQTQMRMLTITGMAAKKGQRIPPEFLLFGKYIKSTAIPDWIKYENALTLLPDKAPHSLMAKLHLEAAHANRLHVCSEIGIPGLYPSFLVNLGAAIRKMNTYVLAECLSIRQRRGETILDPTKPELDAELLAEAAASIIKKGEQMVSKNVQQDGSTERVLSDVSRFSSRDMYVLHIRQAGFLDRAGRIQEAIKALEESKKLIPKDEEQGLSPEGIKYIEGQKMLLRRIADERVECLEREREHLFKAAYRLMGALYAGEMDKGFAVNSYLVGELLVRDGQKSEMAIAAAWFKLTLDLVQNKNLDIPPNQREQLGLWAKERMEFAQKQDGGKGAVNDKVAQAIDRIRQKTGKGAGPGTPSADPVKPTVSDQTAAPEPTKEPVPSKDTATAKTKETDPPVAGGSEQKLSRKDLLLVYYHALKRYAEEKKEQAPTLSALVESGYLKAPVARLDDQGMLYCPESKGKLMYSRSTPLGDKTRPVIFPLGKDTNRIMLFGDGRIDTQ